MSGLGLQVNVEVKDRATQSALTALVDNLVRRERLHAYIGRPLHELTQRHLVKIAQTRHDTAERLGAQPTGHWGKAAEKTTVKPSEEAVTISINQPGIGRAAHDVTIRPGPGKQFLTIPLIAAAYGQRAYRVKGLVPHVRGDRGVLVMPGADKDPASGTAWYALVKSVHQRQDRTLLPSDEEYRLMALTGIRDFVNMLLRLSGGAAPGGNN